ncbi:DUF3047 domain-containing protein [Bradyrhizobium sp. Cp5.3]|uniref:DUF3047 domain-containing protein n=1 Tax=Bradyrhizobium sp. Cp5.3 TaxID=443598 RepID=UPI001FD8B651|nr:DUF3047 domain-containing protein [Bradyrhizobium sp. Cp5.3]
MDEAPRDAGIDLDQGRKRMCFSCFRSPSTAGLSRRDALARACALGLVLPFTAPALRAVCAAEQSGPAPTDLMSGIKDVIVQAKSPELAAYRVFDINAGDLPWTDLGLDAAQGQQVTFLLTGRMWLSREHDLWFNPGLIFHARTRGLRPMYIPMLNTGTMTASHDGPIEVARSAAEWASEDGVLQTPPEIYKKADVRITGIALLWRGNARVGIKSLLAHGDVGDLLASELARLERGRKLPAGWSNLLGFGGGQEVFNRDENGEITCDSAGSASIIERPLSISLASGPRLGWRWKIDQLPSAAAEDQAPTHDYLSIGVKFEDGQDLTYIWSEHLPQGMVFRCPLANWKPIETHMVVRSGKAELGTWQAFERDIAADYSVHIGGPAKSISHVWLLAITPFQRRKGTCRYADIKISTADNAVLKV